ncbi:MAG: DUF86 domain-containing protein [Ottowia sp.]|nr:DUF86 domain-containing protein [Ottowia sp.]
MQEAAANVLRFVAGVSKEDFLENDLLHQSVILNLLIIGEGAAQILNNHGEFAQKYQDVQWRAIRGLRNIIAHNYFSVEVDIIWNTAQKYVKDLQKQLQAMLLDDACKVQGSGEEEN